MIISGVPLNVSIHAPREGCDLLLVVMAFARCLCFNSRTPGGVRPATQATFSRASRFQFTHPGRGATIGQTKPQVPYDVSIHAPREGCDGRMCVYISPPRRFNSRTPGGVRRVRSLIILTTIVSIHAPREGCDGTFEVDGESVELFQFTHPGRGAT